jgi:hypothetical protein
MSPFQMLHDKVPDLGHLRAFGCKAYLHLDKSQRDDKLSDRATIRTLIGYNSITKQYRLLLNAKSGTVYESRDVTFDERLPGLDGKYSTDGDAVEGKLYLKQADPEYREPTQYLPSSVSTSTVTSDQPVYIQPPTPATPMSKETTPPTTPTYYEDQSHLFEELSEYLDGALLDAVTSSNTAANAKSQTRGLRGLDQNNILPERLRKRVNMVKLAKKKSATKIPNKDYNVAKDDPLIAEAIG